MSCIPVAAARSETLIGPAAWMQVSRVSRVGSASTAKCTARVRSDPGSPRAAMAWQTRSLVDDPVAGAVGRQEMHDAVCQPVNT